MNKICCFIILCLGVISCAPSVTQKSDLSEGEKSLRERFVFSTKSNVDVSNSLHLNFFAKNKYQLTELELNIKEGNSSFFSVLNSDSSAKKRMNSNADISIKLNGADITSCIINQCNLKQCTTEAQAVSSLKVGFQTNRLNINLSKIVNDPICNAAIKSNKMNTLEFSAINDSVTNPSFIEIDASIVTFNRSYSALKMSAFLSEVQE